MLLGGEDLSVSGVYLDWWNTQIKAKDYNELSQANIDNYKSKIGIGSKIDEAKNELLENMQKSAPYFLYLYLGEEWARTNRSKYPNIYKKYKIEKALFDSWTENAKKIFNKQTIYNNLRSGFLKKTRQTPEQFVNSVIAKHKEINKIGLATEIIVAIISGVVAILSAVITGIIALCGQSMQSPSNYPSGEPSDNDFDPNNLKNTNTNNIFFKYGLIAIAAIVLLKNKNKNKNKVKNKKK